MKSIDWVILIIILASIFRVFFLNLIEFKADEAYTVYELESFYQRPYLMQVGPISSTKVYNPPLYNYLMIALAVFSREPQVLSFLIGMINAICVGLFYIIAKKYYSNNIALTAALFMALSPVSILYSRKIWNTNLLMPFCLAYFYFLHQFILKKNRKSIFGLFLTLLLASQVHLSALFFAIATLIALIILKKKINPTLIMVAVLIALIPALPYFYRQITSNPICIDCRALIRYQSANLSFDWANLVRPFQVISGIYFTDSLGSDYPLFLAQYPLIRVVNLFYLMEIFIPIAGIYLLIKAKSKYRIILLILALYIAVLLLTRTTAYIYHMIIISPFIYLVYALALNEIKKIFSWKFFVPVVLVVMLAANVIFEICFYKFLIDKRELRGYYGAVFEVTDNFVREQIAPYANLPEFQRIRIFSLAFSQFPPFHKRLGEYFYNNGQFSLASQEFAKAASTSSNLKSIQKPSSGER